MSVELLAELKKLQHQRSDSSPFVNYVEFHAWADKVLPLLSFDPKLHSRFNSMVSATKSARILEIKEQEIENINSAIGMLNQAVAALEIVPITNPVTPPATDSPIEVAVWHNKPLGKISITVIGGTLTACVWYILHLYGIIQ